MKVTKNWHPLTSHNKFSKKIECQKYYWQVSTDITKNGQLKNLTIKCHRMGKIPIKFQALLLEYQVYSTRITFITWENWINH